MQNEGSRARQLTPWQLKMSSCHVNDDASNIAACACFAGYVCLPDARSRRCHGSNHMADTPTAVHSWAQRTYLHAAAAAVLFSIVTRRAAPWHPFRSRQSQSQPLVPVPKLPRLQRQLASASHKRAA